MAVYYLNDENFLRFSAVTGRPLISHFWLAVIACGAIIQKII
jgi:hypothetical protein